MRKIFTLFFMFVPFAGICQKSTANNQQINFSYIVSSCQPSKPEEVKRPVPDSPKVVITSCWARPKPKPLPEPQKSVNIENKPGCKVGGINIQKRDSSQEGSARIIIRCQKTITDDMKPLLIIDGRLTEFKSLSQFNPDSIASVDILKSATATALYGYRGANGVIIVTTKYSFVRKFIIKDFLDGTGIAGATVTFSSAQKKDFLSMAANQDGIVETKALQKDSTYTITVSSVGHLVKIFIFKNGRSYEVKEILMERNVKPCYEVVVVSGPERVIRCFFGTGWVREKAENPVINKPIHFKAYPNPVQKSGVINIEFKAQEEAIKAARLLSLDGKILLQQQLSAKEEVQKFQLSTDSRWPSGIYFVQLLYENGQVAASDKIIIQ